LKQIAIEKNFNPEYENPLINLLNRLKGIPLSSTGKGDICIFPSGLQQKLIVNRSEWLIFGILEKGMSNIFS